MSSLPVTGLAISGKLPLTYRSGRLGRHTGRPVPSNNHNARWLPRDPIPCWSSAKQYCCRFSGYAAGPPIWPVHGNSPANHSVRPSPKCWDIPLAADYHMVNRILYSHTPPSHGDFPIVRTPGLSGEGFVQHGIEHIDKGYVGNDYIEQVRPQIDHGTHQQSASTPPRIPSSEGDVSPCTSKFSAQATKSLKLFFLFIIRPSSYHCSPSSLPPRTWAMP